jgi:4-amino-4-deoxy-L-arabinose transferase-like glycosyltransferase
MPNRFVLLGCFLVAMLCIFAVEFPDGAITLAVLVGLSIPTILYLRSQTEEKKFITSVFLLALMTRIAFGVIMHFFDIRSFFGEDSVVYHENGVAMYNVLMGWSSPTERLIYYSDAFRGVGWGMNYLIGAVYLVVGVNIFASQSIFGFIGALTAPLVYFCAMRVFANIKVAKYASVGIAIFPSFVIWSGQLLKDGVIIFLIVAVMTLVFRLRDKVDYVGLLLMGLALFGILSMRFYIFYITLVAVVGSFIIAYSTTTKAIARNTVGLALVAGVLAYFGVGEQAQHDLTTFATLERIQLSRLDLSQSAQSGFGQDWDVSTTAGALTTIPRGFMYLMLAPYPWHAANLRQAITTPDVLMWWAMIPFLWIGLVYTIRNRLRPAFPILLFSLILTIAYTIFQGNVGTAYRQRTQIQVFLFILIAAGWQVYKENKENKRILKANTLTRLRQHRAEGAVQQQN